MSKLGRFDVLSKIGQGTTGVVYVARDRHTGTVVALKAIDPALLHRTFANVAEQFLEDARSAWRLKQPNIVTIYDAGNADGTVYVAMELLQGENLQKILDDGLPLSIAQCIKIASGVASALAYAHGQGVVHRGIKPSNIIVLPDGSVKVTDFCIARIVQAAIVSRQRDGVLHYMAPEQIRGDAGVDGRADIFALGTVLYQLLTRKLPFTGDTPAALAQAFRLDPPLPSELNPHVPRALDGLVLTLLAEDAVERTQTAHTALRDLQRMEANLGYAAAPVPGRPAAAKETPQETAPDIPNTPKEMVEPTAEAGPRIRDLGMSRFRRERSSDPRLSPDHAPQDQEPDRTAGFHDWVLAPEEGLPRKAAEGYAFGPGRYPHDDDTDHGRGWRIASYAALGLALLVAVAGQLAHHFGTRLSATEEVPVEATVPPAAPASGAAPPNARAVGDAGLQQELLGVASAPAPSASPQQPEPAAPSAAVSPPKPATPPKAATPPSPPKQAAASVPRSTPPVAEAPQAREVPASSPAAPPQAKAHQAPSRATLVVSVAPEGEIYINGKRYGTSPPITSVPLEPGMNRVELRSGSWRPYLTYMTVQPGEVRRIRHEFGAKSSRPPE